MPRKKALKRDHLTVRVSDAAGIEVFFTSRLTAQVLGITHGAVVQRVAKIQKADPTFNPRAIPVLKDATESGSGHLLTYKQFLKVAHCGKVPAAMLSEFGTVVDSARANALARHRWVSEPINNLEHHHHG